MSEPSDPNAASKDDPLPVWIDDTHIDPTWIRRRTQLACTDCRVEDISNQNRRGKVARDGATLRLTVALEDGEPSLSLVIKQVPLQGRPLSQQLGLAREALFYQELASEVDSAMIIPKIWYAHGDMASGVKVVILEDLAEMAVDSGVFFGPGNPNNWTRDLPAMAARAGPTVPTAAQVAKTTFVELAQVHATFWCRLNLLDEKYGWMRGHGWLQGQAKESWEASQGLLTHFWSAYLKREQDESHPTKLNWDPVVRAAVEKGIAGISWEAQLQRLHQEGRWTVVHGDCWPGNFMWMIQKNDHDTPMLKLLDWEMVGLGSGPQDLGQYILSNMDPTERLDCEEDLIRVYFDELLRCGVTNVDWEYCWSEYKMGGLERWLWFLIYFAGQEGLLDWAQFFHNQIAAFMKDHQIRAADVVQPRP